MPAGHDELELLSCLLGRGACVLAGLLADGLALRGRLRGLLGRALTLAARLARLLAVARLGLRLGLGWGLLDDDYRLKKKNFVEDD